VKIRKTTKRLREQVEKERKRRNLIFFSITIVIIFYLSTILIFGDPGIIKYNSLNKTKKKLEMEIKEIEKENKLLQAQINSLKEDPFYIEKYAREEFGLAKPDEYIFQFQEQ
jgi:cell division protein FtsB